MNYELLKNKICAVRSNMAGVFFGKVEEINGNQVLLSNARKIYYWEGANTVEDIAEKGISDSSKVTIANDLILISQFEQINLCTELAIENLNSQKVWTQK